MADLLFFLKLHLKEVIIFFVCVVAGVAIAYGLAKLEREKNPNKPVSKLILLPSLIPLVIFALMMLKSQFGGMEYPTGITSYKDVIIVKGEDEIVSEDDDGIEKTSYNYILSFFNKTTGKEIKHMEVVPRYINDGKILCYDGLVYQVVDIETASVIAALSADEIEEKANVFNEKIYSIELDPGDNAFNVRTVRDKVYTYDPMTDEVDSKTSYYPFYNEGRPAFKSDKFNFFKPQLIGVTRGGITLVFNYEDLERKHYQLSAIDPDENLLWSKWEYEISSKLDGERFDSRELTSNTIADDDYMYFVTDDYLVSVSLKTGDLNWISSI